MITNNLLPLVSIIVPCYKVERYLPTCIESVINQEYGNWELILVDDGSPDRCGNICDDYRLRDSRIRVIHKQNGGLSSARNAGLDVVQGEYLTFLDGDDFLHQDFLKILMDFVISNNADIVQCDYVRGSDNKFPRIKNSFQFSTFDNRSIFIEQAAKIVIWGKIFKSSLFQDIRMPLGLIHEDDWTTWKLYYRAKKIVCTRYPLYYYTANPNSIMSLRRKKPDLTYIGAYIERIAFFREIGDKELEDISRMHLCMSVLLLYSNTMLTSSQRIYIKSLFNENWVIVSKSGVVPKHYKFLFYMFKKTPVVSRLINVFKR